MTVLPHRRYELKTYRERGAAAVMDDDAIHTRIMHAGIVPYFRQHMDEWYQGMRRIVRFEMTPDDVLLVSVTSRRLSGP